MREEIGVQKKSSKHKEQQGRICKIKQEIIQDKRQNDGQGIVGVANSLTWNSSLQEHNHDQGNRKSLASIPEELVSVASATLVVLLGIR